MGALGSGELRRMSTPYGAPSGEILLAEVAGVPVALLARHGAGHRFSPSEVNYRANLYALKQLGVTRVVATTAVGSLREEIAPRHLVIPDQVIDKTFRRAASFFGDGVVVHAELGLPFCPVLSEVLGETGSAKTRVHRGGTYVCMEGPQFSTRAESELHRAWGASLIGMTLMPEAKLAREAELCYVPLALATDYDCWRPHPAELNRHALTEEIRGNLKAATEHALDVIRRALPRLAAADTQACGCQRALDDAVWSDPAGVSPQVRERVALLLPRQRR
jgi:5'-methylthioadenosine phosphorylase